MAHEITELTRSVAPSADYPAGDIKDNPGGTLVNRMMLTDVLQLFQKLMIDAGITPNGLDDNTTNGYQLKDALLSSTVGLSWSSTGITFNTISAVTWANSGAPNYNASYIVSNQIIHLAGVITGRIEPGTITMMTLPAGVRPASQVKIPAMYIKTGGTRVLSFVTIGTSGTVAIESAETDNSVIVYLDGLSFRKS